MDYLQEITLGQMGWSRRDFWESTAREIFNAMSGYFDNQVYFQRQEWERVRWSTCMLVNTQLKKPITPKDLISFEWDREQRVDVPPITQEELERIKKLYD